MAALVVLNLDLSKLPKAAIKKEIQKKLSTNKIYQTFPTKRKSIFSWK